MHHRASAGDKGALWRVAQDLNRAARPQRPLPPLLFFTDPLRTPDPAAVAERLPAGCGVIYRSFGAADASQGAGRLAGSAERRGLALLIGLDERLAEACGAQGVHLPERARAQGSGLKAQRPD